MKSAINPFGTLNAARTAVAVTGPIDCWAVGERKADFWVRIVQGKVVAAGHSEGPKFDRMDEEWKVTATVQTEEKLKKGPAYAEYWARVRMKSGPSIDVYWPVWPIVLK